MLPAAPSPCLGKDWSSEAPSGSPTVPHPMPAGSWGPWLLLCSLHLCTRPLLSQHRQELLGSWVCTLLPQVPWGCCLQTQPFYVLIYVQGFYPVASPCWVICKSLTFCELSHVVGEVVGVGHRVAGGWDFSRIFWWFMVAGDLALSCRVLHSTCCRDASTHPGHPPQPSFLTLMCFCGVADLISWCYIVL